MCTGFILWAKWKPDYYRWFPIYLLMITVAETGGELLYHLTPELHFQSNLYLYGIIPLEFLFFYWFYAVQHAFKHARLAGWIIAITFILVYFGQLIFDTDTFRIPTLGYTVGVIGMLVMCVSYLRALVLSDDLLFFRSQLLFWISCGILLFYLGTLPFYGLPSGMRSQVTSFLNTFFWVPNVLGTVMYILFTLGMIWKEPK